MGLLAIKYYNQPALNTFQISRTLIDKRNKYPFLLTSIAIILGMQSIRVAFPITIWHRSSSVYFLFVTFASGFLTPLIASRLNYKRVLNLAIGCLACVRTLEVIIRNADVDLCLSALGVVSFALALPILLKPTTSEVGNRASRSWAGGLLIGLAMDSAIQGVFWTSSLGSRPDLMTILVQIFLTGLAFMFLRSEEFQGEEKTLDRSWPSAFLLVSIGPYLVLQLLFFQNQGYISELSGMDLPSAFVFVMVSNLASIAGFHLGISKPTTPRAIGAITGIILGASIIIVERMPALIPLGIPLAQYSLGWGMARLDIRGRLSEDNHLIRTSATIGLGLILFIFLLLISYGDLALSVELPSGLAMRFLAILLGGTVILADHLPPSDNPPSTKKLPFVPIVAILVTTSVLHAVTHSFTNRSEIPPSSSVGVMTYNIHSAVSNMHGQDLEAIAQVIEDSGADIIALQEISRGWVLSGGIDMVSWLSNRLEMDAIFAGTADLLWGNSILSRYPIIDSGAGSLPMLDSIIPRGYIWAKIDVGKQSPLLIINTHLQNRAEEQHVRLAQVPRLLEAWENQGVSIILGDLNATPGAKELDLLVDQGFVDSWAERGDGSGNTIPANQPTIRLDWIWHTPDLVALDAQVIPTLASDHLPVVAFIEFVQR